MEVHLRLFATLRERAGERELTRTYEPDGGGTVTVRDVLRDLEAAHPALSGRLLDDGEIRRSLTVLRDGRNVTHYDGAATALDDGDTLSLTPPVSGGAASGSLTGRHRRRRHFWLWRHNVGT